VIAAPARRVSPPPHARIEGWVHDKLEPGKTVYLAALTVLYLAAACATARAKLVWYDEFFTLHLSRLPSIGDIWHALAIGTTNDAPLNYLLTRASFAAMGPGHIAFRFPAIAGIWIMCLCLYAYAARRWGTLWGFVALLLPLATGVWYYACEGRPYGVMMGCAGLAFLCWTEAAEGRRRKLALAGLALSLAAAISTQYVSVLLWMPLAAGELVRSFRKRRADWAVWIAMAAGAAPLAFFIPLLRASHQYSAHIWEGASFYAAYGTYALLLSPILAPLVFALIVCAWETSGVPRVNRALAFALPAHEAAAAIGLALLPFCGYALGRLVTGTYVPRYGLAAIIGVTILFVALTGKRAKTGAILACVFFGCFVFNVAQSPRSSAADASAAYRTLDVSAFQKEGDLPVVVSNADLFLKLEEYGPAALKARLFSLHDTDAAIRFLGNDTGERNMSGLSRVTALPIVDYTMFVRDHRRFLVYGLFVTRFDWLIDQLRASGAHVEYLRQVGNDWLFLIEFP